ncbi:MAG TPA: glycosyltransferase family 2 protein [Candidatus Gallacutalibacter stercoravium]|nr:glycosyltransferase family 2 protein [Candidatus Gallacutalibacter stercoravium]
MVDILMAVYNGQRYVEEQLQSILNQTVRDWRLIIQDDASSDDTWEVVQRYASRYPKQILALRRGSNSGSARCNFFDLMKHAQGEYVMFSDHDDVWLPDKIEVTLAAMRAKEKENPGAPVLVHTDLTVVDERLNTVAPSMIQRQKLNPQAVRFRQLLVQNVVTGCTVMVNKPLLLLAGEDDPDIIMHDWWLALIAACFGGIGFVDKATVLYRQHTGNQVGAKDAGSLRYNWNRARNATGARRALYTTSWQAEVFVRRFSHRMSPEQLEMARAYAKIPVLNKWKRLGVLLRYGTWKRGIRLKVGQVLFI